MQKNFSFRQKLGAAFALLLSLILLHGTVSWFALQEYSNLFEELHDIEKIVELTIRARVDEKNYVATGERHFAITVQEDLQEAQTLVQKTSQHNSSFEVTTLLQMSHSVENYMNTFAQYVIYEDQHRALNSEVQSLTKDFLDALRDLQQLNVTGTDDITNHMYSFLLLNKNGYSSSEVHMNAEQAGQEVASIIKKFLKQEPRNINVKLTLHRIANITDNYLELLNKLEILEERQRLNEEQMQAAAEDVQKLGAIVTKNQQITAHQRQKFTTNIMLVIFSLSIGIAFWGTFYLSTRLTKPLKNLVKITASLGQGDFNKRIEIESEDEFHNLLLSVNEMAENIANLTSNMEELIDERTKALELEKLRFQKLFENSPEGILIFDEDMRVLDANNAFTVIFGYTLPEIHHKKIQDFLLLDNQSPIEDLTLRTETTRYSKNKLVIPVSIVRYSFQQLGAPTLHYAIYTDISERKENENRLNFLSFHDSLTNLKNRTYFELEMKRLQASGETCGIIVCDVDGLKFVNDNFGHAAGDQLLKDAANLLANSVGSQALARVGGDEFVIFLTACTENQVENMAADINLKLSNIKNNEVFSLKMSVGYAYRKNSELNMEELFSLADKMMYAVKNSRKQKLLQQNVMLPEKTF